ncbi:hypothetical protein ACHAXR_009970 [Thalassiosira sp. AJA248-18]
MLLNQAVVEDRFLRNAEHKTSVDEECIIKIDGMTLDVSKWARAHPGGRRILQKFHGKDATRAFRAVGHSDAARAMLEDFCMRSSSPRRSKTSSAASSIRSPPAITWWVKKLFTKEDPWGLHKSLGLFSLGHFAYRFFLLIFDDDQSAGFGGTASNGSASNGSVCMAPVLCLVPHALLSLSSLRFHLEKERVVGKPMIWQEFRAHNIIFGMRSIICSTMAWLSIYNDHQSTWRNTAVYTSCFSVIASCWAADWATQILRHNPLESTTATMPYWEGCNSKTQYIFKYIYAFAQFAATMTCMLVSNPAWPLAVLLPIQGASFLMTLVRKGIISAYSYHVPIWRLFCWWQRWAFVMSSLAFCRGNMQGVQIWL